MAVSVCASALLLGMAADQLRRRGLKTELVLVSTLGGSMSAQAALVLAMADPIVSGLVGDRGCRSRDRLSFALLSEYFPKEMSGRANAALNLLHVGAAFVLQSATGLIIEQWPEAHGTYPAEAYHLVMGIALVMQLAAFAWFALPPRRLPIPALARAASRSLSAVHAWPATAATPYRMAALAWAQHVELASKQAQGWRCAAAASAVLCIGLAATLSMTTSRAAIAIHVFEADHLADIPPSDGGSSVAALIDRRPAPESPSRSERSALAIPGHHGIGFRAACADTETAPATLATNVRAQR